VTSLIVHLMHTLSDFEQDIIDAVIDLWCDHLRSHVHAGGRHFKHKLWNQLSFLCGSSEHLFKLSVQFDAFNGYFVVNFKRWTCVHMHFRCFNFHKVVWQH